MIIVQPLTVRFEGHPIARLHQDGRTESVGNGNPGPDAIFSPGPTLHADGSIALTKPGFTARIEADGTLFVVPPPGNGQVEQRFGRIIEDRLVTGDAPPSGVRLEGDKLVMHHDGKVTNVLGVIDPPTMGRTALIMTAAFFMDLGIAAR